MGPESKGRGWFGKIYNKLETLLVEVDSLASQSTLCLKPSHLSGFKSVRGEPMPVAEVKRPYDPLKHQNLEFLRRFMVEQGVHSNILTDDLVLEDKFKKNSSASFLSYKEVLCTSSYRDANLRSDTTLGDEAVVKATVESSLPDGKVLSTFPLLEEDCDANLTSAATLGNEEPMITENKSRITNTLAPHNLFAGNPLISPGEESVEEDRDESCREVVLTVLAALDIFTDDDLKFNDLLATKIPDVVVQDTAANMRSSNADDDLNLNDLLAAKIPDVVVQDNAANMRSTNAEDHSSGDNNAMRVSTIAPQDMESQKDSSYVDESVLYAARVGTKKLSSFKKNVLDALTSNRRREKEYEQLTIWSGDADMSSDLVTEEDLEQVEAKDSKSSQLLESEDSQWVLV